MRLAREILDRLRETIGPDRLLGVTLSAALPGYAEAAAHLAERCDIDYFGIGDGSYAEPHLLIPPLEIPAGVGVANAAEAKSRLPHTAVIAEGRINRPEIAERALAEGACDLAGMTRALISDPQLLRKAARGEADRIRVCIADNLCIARRIKKFPIACLQNPAAGFEHEVGDESRAADAPRHVVVVGGGPAGLEAARVAAMRGHAVTLLERADRLGGQVALLGRLPRMNAYREVASWREGELRRAGVRIELGHEATAESVAALEPDTVIVATGSVPGGRYAGSVSAVEVAAGAELPDGPAVVIDEEGNRKGVGVAELLAAGGRQVTLVPVGVRAGATLGPAFALPPALGRLREAGVRIVEGFALESAGGDRVVLRNAYDGSPLELEAAVVIDAGRHSARDGIVADLRARGIDPLIVGDARAPRQVDDAIREGFEAARSL
jgi:NADPH-dependent 2,4-dienoyl-CoA reductase/sulfur reductase-like enzyme